VPFAGEAIGAPAEIANTLSDALMSLGFSSFRWKLIARTPVTSGSARPDKRAPKRAGFPDRGTKFLDRSI